MPFQPGDVVIRNNPGFSAVAGASIARGTVGTICRVVTEGSMYKVQYEDFPMCVSVFEDSIRLAPPGTTGPPCAANC